VPIGALADIARRLGRLVLVVDQFEECWTRATPERRHAFLDVVATAITDESADIRFVVTVRADLLDQPLEDPTLGPHVSAGAYVLSPLTATELDDAIVLPASQVGVSFDEGVVADLIAETVTHHGSLPLLQFTLTELYDRRVDGVIGPGALEAIGGLAGAIGRRAEELYRSLGDAATADARDLFARLVTPGHDSPDTRRRARFGELSPGMLAVAARYVEARLLVTDRDPSTREPTVEVAHEALLTRWSRLKGWIDEDRRWLAQLQHLSSAARAWDASDRRDADVYRGVRLEAAIEAIDVEGRAVSGVERSYVDAGRASRDAELVAVRTTSRRLRRRLTAVAAALVVALVAGTLAFVQRRAAFDAADEASSAERTAQIEALVGRAESMRGTQRDTAALLAIEAHRMADTARTRSTLFGTFTDEERFLDAHRFTGDRGTSGIVIATPNGDSAFLTDQTGLLRPYDLDTGALGEALPEVGADERFPVLVASPDGRRIAMASRSDPLAGPSTVGVMDLATRSLAFDPVTVDGPVNSAVFLPDGRLALATGEDGRLVVVDAGTGAEATTIEGVPIPEDDGAPWRLDPVLLRPSSVALAGEELLLGAADGTLRILDAATLQLRRTLEVEPQTLSSLRVIGDGTEAVTSGRLGTARIDLDTGRSVWSVPDPWRCTNLLVIEQAGLLFCGDLYGRLEERDLETGVVLRRLDAQNGNSGSLWSADEGSELVSFGNNEPVVSRWRLDHSGPITRVVASGWRPWDFNHTGDLLLLEQGDVFDGTYRISLLDTTSGTILTTYDDLLIPSWAAADTLFGISLVASPIEYTRAEVGSDGHVGEHSAAGVVVQDPNLIQDFTIDTGKDQVLIR
jgi:WD40 repeat protein